MEKAKLQDVARRTGVAIRTVTQILNNRSKGLINKAVIHKVVSAAAQSGYLDRRQAPRKKLKASASIKVRLRKGRPFSEFKGEVINISSTGMLLKSFSGPNKGLPLEPFYLEIDLVPTLGPACQRGKSGRVTRLKAKPIRFDHLTRSDKNNGHKLALGVQFIDLPKDDNEFLKLLAQAKEAYRKS
jgi:c-di-GMP-binding flagellar brake protein YcgR